MAIVDQHGNPMPLAQLPEEIARGSISSVRQPWFESIARGLTPAQLVSILERAAAGDMGDQLTLAEEMEERDPHYAAVLGVRKRAVSGLTVAVESAADDAASVRHADMVRELVRRTDFPDLVEDLLDGLGKAYAAVEIVWQRGTQWWPQQYCLRDPRWFMWDLDTGQELRLVDASNPAEGIALPAFKFIVHRPRIKAGLTCRSGLARLVAFAWIAKSYALKDWVAFAEVFGMPMRLGRYDGMASAEDVRILKRAVAAIGSDAAAVLPKSMDIDFPSAVNATGGADIYKALCEYLDRQISKVVLGQTMTTDAQASGLGSNNASVHNDVRADICRSDARQLAATLNRDLVRPFIDLNFGPQKAYPRIDLQVVDAEDLTALTEALAKLVPLGWEVEQSVISDKFGLPEPAPGAKLFRSAATSESQLASNNSRSLALNREQPRERSRDAIDELVDDGLADWQEQIGEILDPVEQLAADSATAEEFLGRLPDLMASIEPTKLLQSLALQAFKARGMGDATDEVD